MNWLSRREFPAFSALVLLWLFLAFAAPRFFEADNLRDIALTNASLLLVSCGMTFIIILGEIDISAGSVFGVLSVLCGLFAKTGMPLLLVALLVVLAGALLGLVNGFLVAIVRAPSIVVTLATMVILREALRWATGGAWIEGLPANFQWFGLGQGTGEWIIDGVTLLLFLLILWASDHWAAMRFIYAAGSHKESARLSGIPVQRLIWIVFSAMGAITGLATVLNAVRFSDVPANSGLNLELKAIAAVVVGGTSISGGTGSLTGTLAGVVLLGSIAPALTFLGINPYWEKAVQGIIILATVLLEGLSARRMRMSYAR